MVPIMDGPGIYQVLNVFMKGQKLMEKMDFVRLYTIRGYPAKRTLSAMRKHGG